MLTTWYCFSFSVWVNTFPWACDELKTLLISYHSTIIGPVPAGQGFLLDDNPHVQCSTTPISFIKSCYLWTAFGYFVRLHLNKRLFFHLLKPVVCSLFILLIQSAAEMSRCMVAPLSFWKSHALGQGATMPHTVLQKPSAPYSASANPMEVPSQDLLLGGSQPQRGLQLNSSQSAWFGHKAFPELEEKWNILSFGNCWCDTSFLMQNRGNVNYLSWT